jgi:hypothetical protein
MLKKVGMCVFLGMVTVASINVSAADVKAIATTQNMKVALNDVITLNTSQEVLRHQAVTQDTQSAGAQLLFGVETQIGLLDKASQSNAESESVLTSMWVLGAALFLFVLRTSRRKV